MSEKQSVFTPAGADQKGGEGVGCEVVEIMA